MKPTRRQALAAMGTAGILAGAQAAVGQLPRDAVSAEDRITRGKIRQSVMGWCFNPMPAVELARHCKTIGLVAIEGIGAQHYDAVRDIGLEISLVGSHGFAR
ncbi:MAG: hypothetical protein N2C14_34220, partial [Planctomycetales bacterium]